MQIILPKHNQEEEAQRDIPKPNIKQVGINNDTSCITRLQSQDSYSETKLILKENLSVTILHVPIIS